MQPECPPTPQQRYIGVVNHYRRCVERIVNLSSRPQDTELFDYVPLQRAPADLATQ